MPDIYELTYETKTGDIVVTKVIETLRGFMPVLIERNVFIEPKKVISKRKLKITINGNLDYDEDIQRRKKI